MLTVYNNMRTLFNRQAEANNDLFFSELRFTSAFDYKDPIISHLIKEIDNGIPIEKIILKLKTGITFHMIIFPQVAKQPLTFTAIPISGLIQ